MYVSVINVWTCLKLILGQLCILLTGDLLFHDFMLNVLNNSD